MYMYSKHLVYPQKAIDITWTLIFRNIFHDKW